MTLTTTTRLAALVLSLSALAGCPAESGLFDFQDSWRGALTDQTYAVGASMDIVVYGPAGFDMNNTIARTLSDDGEPPVRLDHTERYPEFGCIITTGEAEVPGDGQIAVADLLTRRPLDQVAITTDTVDGVGLGRGINLWNGTLGDAVGGDINVLAGGNLSLGVAPTNLDGEILSGNLPIAASFSGGEVQSWDGVVELWSPGAGRLDVTLGDFERSVDIVTVAAAQIVQIEVEALDVGVRGGMNELGGETLLVLNGLTEDGSKVLGLDGAWTVDGWDYGTGDQMWSYGADSGRVCWNGLCATF